MGSDLCQHPLLMWWRWRWLVGGTRAAHHEGAEHQRALREGYAVVAGQIVEREVHLRTGRRRAQMAS